jgi:propanol-preferring alcohol dehydrogenase
VVGFARSAEKLAVARENGADHTVNVRDKTVEDVQNELEDLTGRRTVDAINDNLEALGRGDIVGRAVVVFD